nr:MAG TPA: hypothetical protein [Bacteriophage sp.]
MISQHHHHDANSCKIHHRIIDEAITNRRIVIS